MRAIFIDRDGVINKDPAGWTKHSYVTHPNDLHFLPGALKALKMLADAGIRVVIISNQAGVGKGFFTKEHLDAVSAKMINDVRKAGGAIEAVYYCVHKKEDGCSCRKPKPGMLENAMAQHKIPPRDTFFIGDSEVDVLAGRAAGLKTIFVLSGKTPYAEMRQWHTKPDHVFDTLLAAVEWILAKERRRSFRAEKRKTDTRKKEEPQE